MRFIGRNAELQQLSRFLDRSPDSLAVVYGRRRVGKSELLRQALKHSGLQYVFFETSELRSSLRNFESQNEYGYKPCIKRRFQNAETLQPRNQKNSS